MNEFTVSNELLAAPVELRRRASAAGYLFFRGLLDTADIIEVRRDILSLCEAAGWLSPGTNLMDGIARIEAACVEPQPAFMAVYNQVMKLESFHALAHQPALLGMLETLFGEPVLAHPRNIARIIFPQLVEFTTPSHQDFIHIQGTPETWTAWFPLGDCPRELGSLAVLAGSHHEGIYATHPTPGAGGLGVDTATLPYEWAAADFQSGDVVLFHSHTVHRGLPNLSPDRIRLSVDFRYQGVSQPVTAGSLEPHHGQISWEEIYEGWQSSRLQYYWRDLSLNVVDWSPQYLHLAVPAEKLSRG